MRFRLGEDERLYDALRTEVYLRLLTHVPKTALSEVMRNIQKMEAMSYGEGIKQGMAVATLSKRHDLTPIVQHAAFYGDASTPLVRVEQAVTGAQDLVDPWAHAAPVDFPPQTIAEALAKYGPTLEPADARAEAAPQRRKPARRAPIVTIDEEDEGDEEPLDEDKAADEAAIAAEIAAGEQAAEERGEDRAQSPDLLDRIRTQIKTEMKNGWEPKTWPEVIMRLMLSMQIDAAYLDLQLGGEQGRAVLDQCGLHHIFPGSGVVVGVNGEFAGVRS